MHTPSIAALIQAPGADAQRITWDAAEPANAPQLAQALADATDQDVQRHLESAKQIADAGDHRAAAQAALKAVTMSPDNPAANHVMALTLYHLGHLAHAIDFFQRAIDRDPTNPDIYHHVGITAWKLDSLDTAEKFYRMALAINREHVAARINLAGILRDTERYDDAIDLLRAAIYANPEIAQVWNCLGSILLEASRPDDAQTFLMEALRLDRDFARAWHNLAYARAVSGNPSGALEAYTHALRNPMNEHDRIEMLHGRSQSHFTLGQLKQGWDDYECRFSPYYQKITVFDVEGTRWDREADLTGRCVLVMGEQGLGDEVLYMNALPDLIEAVGPQGHVIIACEPRLRVLVKRSFPDVTVIGHTTTARQGREWRAAPDLSAVPRQPDIWAPMGVIAAGLRSTLDAFPTQPGYLAPDPDRVDQIRTELKSLGPGLKVGICWKSKIMTRNRAKYFASFDQWAPVLQTQGAHFINLQYGDVSAEIARAAESFGVTLHQIPELDLMNDLDGVAAAGAALDLTMGPMNASTNLAAAAGCPYWVIAIDSHWPLFGLDRMAWYPGSRAFTTSTIADYAPALAKMAEALGEHARARQGEAA